MKLSVTLLGLVATRTLCSTPSTIQSNRDALEAECGTIDTTDWNLENIPEDTDFSRLCSEHPSSLGINSTSYTPGQKAEDLESSIAEVDNGQSRRDTELYDTGLMKRRLICSSGGRGSGSDYDYGCDGGWCWTNCDGPWYPPPVYKKKWCWMKYEGGANGWTPCGRWQDCKWSYENKNARCAKGSCKSCGCGC